MARRRRKIGGVFILLLLFIIAVTVALTVPVFNITSVIVTGNARLSEEEVLAVAGIPVGTNIYRVSMGKAEERLTAMPYVLSAEARRKFPARVHIKIEEREEKAAVVCDGGYAVIDSTARVLRLSAEEENLPLVSGSGVVSASPGKTIEMKEEGFCDDFTALLSALDAADMGIEISRIAIENTADVSVETEHGLEIHLGGMDDLDYKFKLCKNIICGGHGGINRESGGVLRWTSQGQFSYRQSKN